MERFRDRVLVTGNRQSLPSDDRPNCSVCELGYHRYCPADPEHEYSAMACVNMMRDRIEVLTNFIADLPARCPNCPRCKAEAHAVLAPAGWHE